MRNYFNPALIDDLKERVFKGIVRIQELPLHLTAIVSIQMLINLSHSVQCKKPVVVHKTGKVTNIESLIKP